VKTFGTIHLAVVFDPQEMIFFEMESI